MYVPCPLGVGPQGKTEQVMSYESCYVHEIEMIEITAVALVWDQVDDTYCI